MFHWLAALLVLVTLAAPSSLRSALQQDDPAIVDPEVQPEFGQQITFRARIEPADGVEKMLVYITPAGQPTAWEAMTLNAQGQAAMQVDVRRLSLVPFSTINYRFEAHLENGDVVSGEPMSFQYDDTRFDWQRKAGGIFEVYWYGGEVTLGQEILDIAGTGFERSQGLLDVEPPASIRIYAYASPRDLQTALQLAAQSWVAGHASPELGMILISLKSGPEKKLELQRQIPHEIMHLFQYQVTGIQYTRQPAWLLEGMASLAELYPDPEYRRVLEETARQNDLLPMETLCASFPPEAGLAFRSYAQSESFVGFLHTSYGTADLRRLMDAYQDGLGCAEGLAAVYGSSLSQLEYRWKQETLGINPGGLALRRLSPYLFLGLLIVLPALLALWPYHPRRQAAAGRQ
jgi:hypothetical protein